MKKIVVLPYDSSWRNHFEQIRNEIEGPLNNSILGIEHVGSTSVEDLASKPIIDIDIIIEDYSIFDKVKIILEILGYEYEGNLGITDRHAFTCFEKHHLMKHHLYVCPKNSLELQKHIAFRDYLRTHEEDKKSYSNIKILAATLHSDNNTEYIKMKNSCIEEILEKALLK